MINGSEMPCPTVSEATLAFDGNTVKFLPPWTCVQLYPSVTLLCQDFCFFTSRIQYM